MFELTEQSLRRSGALMWILLLLIITLQVTSWSFSRTPVLTHGKILELEQDLNLLNKCLDDRASLIHRVAEDIRILKKTQLLIIEKQKDRWGLSNEDIVNSPLSQDTVNSTH